MTRDEIAQMMQDSSGMEWGTEAHFQRFASLVAAQEREACAKVCESLFDLDDDSCSEAEQCAAAIRSRGNT